MGAFILTLILIDFCFLNINCSNAYNTLQLKKQLDLNLNKKFNKVEREIIIKTIFKNFSEGENKKYIFMDFLFTGLFRKKVKNNTKDSIKNAFNNFRNVCYPYLNYLDCSVEQLKKLDIKFKYFDFKYGKNFTSIISEISCLYECVDKLNIFKFKEANNDIYFQKEIKDRLNSEEYKTPDNNSNQVFDLNEKILLELNEKKLISLIGHTKTSNLSQKGPLKITFEKCFEIYKAINLKTEISLNSNLTKDNHKIKAIISFCKHDLKNIISIPIKINQEKAIIFNSYINQIYSNEYIEKTISKDLTKRNIKEINNLKKFSSKFNEVKRRSFENNLIFLKANFDNIFNSYFEYNFLDEKVNLSKFSKIHSSLSKLIILNEINLNGFKNLSEKFIKAILRVQITLIKYLNIKYDENENELNKLKIIETFNWFNFYYFELLQIILNDDYNFSINEMLFVNSDPYEIMKETIFKSLDFTDAILKSFSNQEELMNALKTFVKNNYGFLRVIERETISKWVKQKISFNKDIISAKLSYLKYINSYLSKNNYTVSDIEKIDKLKEISPKNNTDVKSETKGKKKLNEDNTQKNKSEENKQVKLEHDNSMKDLNKSELQKELEKLKQKIVKLEKEKEIRNYNNTTTKHSNETKNYNSSLYSIEISTNKSKNKINSKIQEKIKNKNNKTDYLKDKKNKNENAIITTNHSYITKFLNINAHNSEIIEEISKIKETFKFHLHLGKYFEDILHVLNSKNKTKINLENYLNLLNNKSESNEKLSDAESNDYLSIDLNNDTILPINDLNDDFKIEEESKSNDLTKIDSNQKVFQNTSNINKNKTTSKSQIKINETNKLIISSSDGNSNQSIIIKPVMKEKEKVINDSIQENLKNTKEINENLISSQILKNNKSNAQKDKSNLEKIKIKEKMISNVNHSDYNKYGSIISKSKENEGIFSNNKNLNNSKSNLKSNNKMHDTTLNKNLIDNKTHKEETSIKSENSNKKDSDLKKKKPNQEEDQPIVDVKNPHIVDSELKNKNSSEEGTPINIKNSHKGNKNSQKKEVPILNITQHKNDQNIFINNFINENKSDKTDASIADNSNSKSIKNSAKEDKQFLSEIIVYDNENNTFNNSINNSKNDSFIIHQESSINLLTYDIEIIAITLFYYGLIFALIVLYVFLFKILFTISNNYFKEHQYIPNHNYLFICLIVNFLIFLILGIITYGEMLYICIFLVDSELISAAICFHHLYGRQFGPLGFFILGVLLSNKMIQVESLIVKIFLICIVSLLFFYLGFFISVRKIFNYEKLKIPIRKPKSRRDFGESMNSNNQNNNSIISGNSRARPRRANSAAINNNMNRINNDNASISVSNNNSFISESNVSGNQIRRANSRGNPRKGANTNNNKSLNQSENYFIQK